MPKSDRVLVVRLSAMGDVAMTVHAVAALRRAYPDVAITMLTRRAWVPFFRDVERVDFLTLEGPNGEKGVARVFRLAAEAAASGVTHVADLHDVLRTKLLRMLLRLRGCRVAKIDKEKALKERATRPTDKDLTPLRHSVERYADVLGAIGYPIELPKVMRHQRVLPAPFGERTEGRWIGLAPFSKQEGKTYPSPQREQLVEMAAAEFDRVFIFSGGGAEREFAGAMESRHPNVTAVFGRIRLDEEVDLMANLDAMVSMDSSAMHMASLVGTPTVSVWGATHPATGFYGWGSSSENQVQLDLPCRPCSVYGERECALGDYRCMRIDPTLIIKRLKAITE